MKIARQIFKVFLFSLFFFLVFIPSLKADFTPPEIEWEKDFGPTFGGDSIQTNDGSIVLAGGIKKFTPYGLGKYNDMYALLLKMNLKGEIEWFKEYPETAPGCGPMIQTSDGGYAIAGAYATDSDPYYADAAFLIKTDSEGNLEWNASFPQTGAQGGIVTLTETKEGDFIIGGYNPNGWIIKADSSGNLVWNRLYDVYRSVSCLIESDQGNIIGVGTSRETYNDSPCLFELNQSGDVQWTKIYESYAVAKCLLKKNGEGYIIVGGSPFYAMETDLEGNVKWEQTYFESSLGYSVMFAQNYGYLLLGTHKNDIYLIRTNNDGIAEWNTTLGSSFVSAITCTLSDGGYIISGTKKILDGTTSEPEKHIWVIKLASEQPEQNTNIETILIETLLAINVEVILIVAILLLIVVIVSLFLLEKTVRKAMNTRFSSLMLFPPFSIIALVHKTH